MAVEDGSAEYPVIRDLLDFPQRFSFFQTVSLLEKYCANENSVSIGYRGPTELETVRIRPYASLGFSSADVKRVERLEGENENRFRLEVTFMGLYGTVSPLPAFYTESIIRDTDSESNRRDFLDLFHHRAISLHYRSLTKYKLFNRLKPGLEDEVSNWLFALIGLHGVKKLEKPPLKRLERLLANLGLLATQNRSGAIVGRIVSHYFFDVPVRIQEFVERNVTIDQSQRIRLGQTQTTLGEDMSLGQQVRDCAGKFRVWIGPLDFDRFRDFLPSGSEYEELVALVRYLLQDPLDFDLGLIVKQKKVPKLALGNKNECQLGWSSWLGNTDSQDKHIIISRSSS